MSVAQRQNASDIDLLTHNSPSSGEPDSCAPTQQISQYPGDRQTKRRTETDIRTNRRTSRHRQTRVRTETKQDGQDRNRDKRQKTTDENQETRTVVRYGVHCDAAVMVGGWLCGGCVVLLSLFVLCGCVVAFVVRFCVSPVGGQEWWPSPFSTQEVAVCPLLP